ncbi:DUF742 domain-containing protein [Streptomyces sp. NPDC050548]|uniref:DUF742 domain-containing protein n=1 Tax=Streptomyces sp. NPDC050548 TaxID=3365629 RepID=UPI0037A86A00
MSGPRRDPDMIRPYVRTGGRVRPTRTDVRLETLVKAAGVPNGTLPPDARRVLTLVGDAPGALAVADIAAALDLPLSTVRILVSDLLDSRHLATPVDVRSGRPDISILQEVLRGLRAKV